MKSLKSLILASLVMLLLLLSGCGRQATQAVTHVTTVVSEFQPTTASIEVLPTAVPPTQLLQTEAPITVVPTTEVLTIDPPATAVPPTESLPTEACSPAIEGPLAGVDPRGQTVVWWHNHSQVIGEAVNAMVAEFNSINECSITIDAQYEGSYADIRDKMNASIATGELPGLVIGYQNDEASYAQVDGLADINPYMNDPYWGLSGVEREDFYPAFLQQGIHPAFDNQRFGFPPNRSAEVIFYNLSWIKELGFSGPPTTPEEFMDIACTATASNGDGTGGYILRSDASGVAAWTYAFGGDILSEDGLKYIFNGQATIDSLTFLKGLLDEGCAYKYTKGYPDPQFANRKAIFTQGSTAGINFYVTGVATAARDNNRSPDEWGITAIPHATTYPYTNIYGGDVMIPRTNPETQLAAWIFIKWFTQPENMAKWDETSGYFPTRRSAKGYLVDYVALNPQFGDGLDLLEYSKYEPQLISYQRVRELVTRSFNEIMQGADISSTLDNLTEQANALQAELQPSP